MAISLFHAHFHACDVEFSEWLDFEVIVSFAHEAADFAFVVCSFLVDDVIASVDVDLCLFGFFIVNKFDVEDDVVCSISYAFVCFFFEAEVVDERFHWFQDCSRAHLFEAVASRVEFERDDILSLFEIINKQIFAVERITARCS